jgi:hypothetical protein
MPKARRPAEDDVVGLHCRLIGRPGRAARAAPLPRLRESRHDRVWLPRRIDIAATGARHHPYAAPMNCALAHGRDGFVDASAASSSIRRGSPSAPSTSNSAPRMTAPAACTMRCAAPSVRRQRDERLGVLKAHPDLAGKLAQAKRLTAESTAEQAERRARRADRRGARDASPSSTTPMSPSSAFPSSSRCATTPRPRSCRLRTTRIDNDREPSSHRLRAGGTHRLAAPQGPPAIKDQPCPGTYYAHRPAACRRRQT